MELAHRDVGRCNDRRIKRFKMIPALVTYNTLLKATFGLLLLDLRLCSAKSQERVTFPRMLN
jgi:hypothetical protein